MIKSDTDKIPVIVVTGATASGKTAMAVELAKIFGAEVVSADSMQIYKGMDIASAKPTAEEMQNIPHHLIDFLPMGEKYSVAAYVKDAGETIKEIRKRGRNVIVCGGTGLYIDSLIDNISFEPQEDNGEIREKLRKRRAEEGIESLYNELAAVDKETADSLHINNEGRVLRALETYYLTGEKPSVIRKRSRETESPYIPVFIGMDYRDREVLYGRIEKRVDIMLEKGLVKEAEEYFSLEKNMTSSQAIGHKELAPFLLGEISLSEAADNLKKATRHYAKRQMTWFRKNQRINSIYVDDYENFDAAVMCAADIIRKTGLF